MRRADVRDHILPFPSSSCLVTACSVVLGTS